MSRTGGLRRAARHALRPVGVVLAATALGCQSAAPPPSPAPVFCDEILAVERYLDAASQRIADATPFGELDAREQVTLAIRWNPDGSLREARVVKASRDAVGAIALRAAEDAAPYPAPPHPECLVKHDSFVILVSLGPRCDEARASDYMDDVAAQVLARLGEREHATQPGAGRVVLDVTLEETGVVRSAEVVRADDPAAGVKAAAATREIGAFPPLEAAIYGCTNRGSFNVWLTVPGMPLE